MTKTPTPPTMQVKNSGPPIKLTAVQLNGVCAGAGRAGDKVKVWTRLAVTSDDPIFHRITEGFASVLTHYTEKAGVALRLDRANVVLLVIRPDDMADLWVDTAAVAIQAMAKRNIPGPSVVFDSDLADVTGMAFPCVTIGKADRVLCLFRVAWSFALFFDFNPDGDFTTEEMEPILGKMYRTLHYRHLYQAVANDVVLARVMAAGWFPFVEIVPGEFKELFNTSEAGFDLSDVEKKLVDGFDATRLERMFERWKAKPHFAAKEALLRSAVNSYLAKDPIPVLKIVLTEIEGILADAHRAVHGSSAKLKVLLKFAKDQAASKAGGLDTLLFPVKFAEYLDSCTFVNFDPVAQSGTAGSRHAVGHGAAKAETYTMVRALQALLTLDQLAFYT